MLAGNLPTQRVLGNNYKGVNMFGIGEALGIGGSILGALGGGEKGQTQVTKSPFESLPKEVQDAFIKTYLPDVLSNYARPFEAMPFQRYEGDPKDPFYNPQLANLQKYSDQYGGLITPNATQQSATPVDSSQDQQAAMDAAMDAMRLEMAGRVWAGSNMRGGNISNAQKYLGNAANLTPEDYQLFGIQQKYGMNPDRVLASAQPDYEGYKTALRSINPDNLSPQFQNQARAILAMDGGTTSAKPFDKLIANGKDPDIEKKLRLMAGA